MSFTTGGEIVTGALPTLKVGRARSQHGFLRPIDGIEIPYGLIEGAKPGPCLLVTAGVHGSGGRYNTMPDERVEVADYLDAVRIYLLAIEEICEFDRVGT